MRTFTQEKIGVYRQAGGDFWFIDEISSSQEKDGIFVHTSKALDALDGDRVCFRSSRGRLGKMEARITHIQERSRTIHYGRIFKKWGWHIEIFSRFLLIRIRPESIHPFEKELSHGMTVGVRVTGYGKHMEALLVEKIGLENEPNYYRRLLLAQSGVPQHFSPVTLKEAEKLAIPNERDWIRRVDCRNRTICTIDGADAKDLDDAIEVEALPDDAYRLTVHIADVAEYVRPGTELDTTARERGTSVYLVNQVIPMLPPKLSDSLCSLQAGTPKFCLSLEMLIDAKGKVYKTTPFESVIQSSYRATYQEVEDDLHHKPTNIPPKVSSMLAHAWKLKKILDIRRRAEGKIDFPSTENQLILEENVLVKIQPVVHLEAHELIEQFMVLANEEVSKWLSERNLDTVYRIHPEPSQGGIGRLEEILQTYWLSLVLKDPLHPKPKEIARALELLRAKDTAWVTNKWAISSMSKALYSTKNIGHFGLALTYYSHFTSPIRRYPDLLTHRAVKAFLAKEAQTKTPKSTASLEIVAKDCSTKERRAEKLEYDFRDTLICEWLAQRIGECFEGRITTILEKGSFVEIFSGVEGFAPRLTRPTIQIGAPVSVEILSVDIRLRRIELRAL